MSNGATPRMLPPVRTVIFVTFATLWVSGCLWLVLHLGFAQQTQFGPGPNPWEPTLLRVHGWLAVGGVFLLGSISAGHISERWTSRRRRPSGIPLAILAALLIVSGYALYYTTEPLHDIASTTHELVGAATILIALTHWLRSNRARAER